MKKKRLFVLSIGGSIVAQDKLNIEFLKQLKKFLEIRTKKGEKFIIVIGGGKTARKYISALKSFTNNKVHHDEIGIEATKLNANLVRLALGNLAYKEISINPNKKINFKKVLISGGYKPGASTDLDAVLYAKTYKAKEIINMTNVNILYNKNPKIYKNAKPIKYIDWNGFFKIIPKKFVSGQNVPFDIKASKLAKELKKNVFMIGPSIDNLKNLIEGKKYVGSIIASK